MRSSDDGQTAIFRRAAGEEGDEDNDMHVHPIVSVITLTATGLLCYAGHVCNYYCKTFEWFKGLPAVLRGKHMFLIKRRCRGWEFGDEAEEAYPCESKTLGESNRCAFRANAYGIQG